MQNTIYMQYADWNLRAKLPRWRYLYYSSTEGLSYYVGRNAILHHRIVRSERSIAF